MIKRFRYFFAYSIVFLALLTIFRFLFILKYSYRMDVYEPSLVFRAILIGIQFDLASLAMILGLFWILSSLHILNRYRLYVIIWSYLPILLFAWVLAHMIGDLIYFENANKHIGYEGFVFFGKDLFTIISSFAKNDPLTFFLSIIGISFYIIFSFKIYRKYFQFEFLPEKFWITVRNVIIVLVFSAILIRGGINDSPLRASHSIISEDNFINNIALNGIFTSIMDMKSQKIPSILKMDELQAVEIVRAELDYEGAKWANDPQFPLLRKTIPKKNRRLLINKNIPSKPNIVIILLESWTGKLTASSGNGFVNGIEVTPYFNALSKKGHSFQKFFATGGRTTNGMLSILTGIPDRPGLTAVRTPQILSNFSGIGNILKPLGYNTIFVKGADLSFDNVKLIMPRWGFDTVYGKEYIESLNEYPLGAWGYDDENLLKVLEKEIDKTSPDKPFLATALTMTTHYPYKVPDKKFEIFDKDVQDFDYFNTMHYADWAIHNFIESMKKSARFKNTIFIFVGDHTHHRFLNYYEDRNVPLLVYAPGIIGPKQDNRITSQLDIVPTILGLINEEISFSAMGRDLLDPSANINSAYFAYGSSFGWIEENLFYFQYSDGPQDLKLTVNPPHIDFKECEMNPLICQMSNLKAKAFYNLSMDLMNQNRIFPGNQADSK
ncbi:MAG: sulfatase-like hydrolase/transferase [Leptospiraceae bacterium]|nr:sulfatase-like hydrolase/transferase [Leptospiraceae bacterium]